MSEEIKNEAQDLELNPEEMNKVSGGGGEPSSTYTCPICGKVFGDADTILGELNIKWHEATHMVP